jgi:hypothetical protein
MATGCTTGCEADTNFANESIYLLVDNIWNEVGTIQRAQGVLKMLFLYTYTFLALAEEVLIYTFKLFCRIICNFLTGVPFWGYCCQLCPSNNSRRKKHKN